jgi:hypothetical protein
MSMFICFIALAAEAKRSARPEIMLSVANLILPFERSPWRVEVMFLGRTLRVESDSLGSRSRILRC